MWVAWLAAPVAAVHAVPPTFVPFPNPIAGLPAQASQFVPDGHGRILITGQVAIPRDGTFNIPLRAFVGRLTADGRLDGSFGQGGAVILDPERDNWPVDAPLLIRPSGLALLPDGRIQLHNGYEIARLLPDGSPDASFNGGGTRVPDGLFGFSGFTTAIPLGDGGTLLAGVVPRAGGASGDIAFVRLGPDGRVDRSYGADGMVTVSLQPDVAHNGEGTAIGHATADGGALVAVGAYEGPANRAGIARFDRDGRLVGGFGRGDGIAMLDLPGTTESLIDVLEQPDGRLIALIERVPLAPGYARNGVWRLDARGQPDTRFGQPVAELPVVPGGGPVGFLLEPRRPDEALIVTQWLQILRVRGMTADVLSAGIDAPEQVDYGGTAAGLIRPDPQEPDKLFTASINGRSIAEYLFAGWFVLLDLRELPPPVLPTPPLTPGPPDRFSLTVSAGGGGPFGRVPVRARAVGVGEPVTIRLGRRGDGPPLVATIETTYFAPVRPSRCQVNGGAVCRLVGADASDSASGSFTRPHRASLTTHLRVPIGDTFASPGPGAVVTVHDPRSVVTRANRREVAGTARGHGSSAGERIARVEVAVGRKVGGRCRWLGSGKARPCGEPRWRKASGTRRWRLRLPRRLVRGRYLVQVRAIDAAGVPERPPARPQAGRRKFRAQG